MSKDLIRWDLRVNAATKGVIRKALSEVARDGLPGEHHFFITFLTNAPGVRLSQRLRDKYPDKMTIVLQHQFWDLAVTEHALEVGLSFSGIPERLLVPFDAMVGFYDPSVPFGIEFAAEGMEEATPSPETSDTQRGKRGAVPAIAPVTALSRRDDDMPAEAPTKKTGKDKAEKPSKAAARDKRPAEAKAKPLPEGAAGKGADETPASLEAPASGATVVSLDSFRKKSDNARQS